MTDFVASYQLTHKGVMKMIAACVAKAEEIKSPMGIAVVDAGGNLLAWQRMDGGKFFAIDAVLKKARTAAAMGRPTGAMPEDGALRMALAVSSFANLQGGFPIIRKGQIIGGIAAGGGKSEEDNTVAQAGLAALDPD